MCYLYYHWYMCYIYIYMYNIYINNYIYLYVLSLIQKMGYMCAPTYANIFMSEFEERFIYPLI